MRFLLASWGSLGDLFPFLGLAQKLQARGHEVLLVGPSGWEEHTERAQVPFVAAAPDPWALREVAQLWSQRRWGLEALEALVEKGAYAAALSMAKALLQLAPEYDCLVAHHFAFGGAFASQRAGLPWVTVCLSPVATPSGGLPPPVFPKLPLPFFCRQTLWKMAAGWISRRFDPGFNRLRHSLGLPPARGVLYDYSPKLVLHLYSRILFSPSQDWPSHHRICGYSFYENECEVSPELLAFMERGSPPWVFTLGSTMVARPGRFYVEAYEAAKLSGVRAVLLTGPETQQRFPPDPQILVLARAPHSWLFPRSLAVTHCCGAGTLSKTLRAGRPSVFCPCLFDQPIHARLGELRHFGVTLSSQQWNARRFAQALDRALTPEIVQSVRRAQRELEKENGAQTASQLLEEFAASEKPWKGFQFGQARLEPPHAPATRPVPIAGNDEA
ncbi:glycosyltransferase [Candidatus Methylacidithermus pantelleriae]|uniref:Putative O-mycaminosyltylonolide 6-deoxyallosyltransferase n=1 Tax=Candidatus Methylacidithermus pantelleriae TaxID=2744239 RepID=A0A8J2FSM3_9BACT|nr:glycosyltransferase [Candidatus Methylacidithermus pantelleriae]CAF0699261.1 putative O-mycaminosyltylonolide 6-deoxyallosyltransferase [Candidatus Methylacidithermus pantelleriae]